MSHSGGELWEQRFLPDEFDIDVLLPTGILCSMKAQRDLTLKLLKEEAWTHAKSLPLHESLGDRRLYVFTGVTQDGRKEEFVDEASHVSQLKLFMPVLQLLQPEGDKAEQGFAHALRDIGVPVHELDSNDATVEEVEYRRWLLQEAKRLHNERRAQGFLGRAMFEFPPEVDLTRDLPDHLRSILPDGKIDLIIRVTSIRDRMRHMYHFVESESCTPAEIVRKIVWQSAEKLLPAPTGAVGGEQTTTMTNERANELCEYYALKVCGRLTFIMGNHKISQFKYIRQCIKLRKHPTLIIVDLRDNWLPPVDEHDFFQPSLMRLGGNSAASSSSLPSSSSSAIQTNNNNNPTSNSSVISSPSKTLTRQFSNGSSAIAAAATGGASTTTTSYAVNGSSSTIINNNNTTGFSISNSPVSEPSPQSMWRIGTQNFMIHLMYANSVFPANNDNVPFDAVYIIAGLYHGVELLCAPRYSEKRKEPIFKERLTFDIDYNNIPLSAKLCISVCGVWKRTSGGGGSGGGSGTGGRRGTRGTSNVSSATVAAAVGAAGTNTSSTTVTVHDASDTASIISSSSRRNKSSAASTRERSDSISTIVSGSSHHPHYQHQRTVTLADDLDDLPLERASGSLSNSFMLQVNNNNASSSTTTKSSIMMPGLRRRSRNDSTSTIGSYAAAAAAIPSSSFGRDGADGFALFSPNDNVPSASTVKLSGHASTISRFTSSISSSNNDPRMTGLPPLSRHNTMISSSGASDAAASKISSSITTSSTTTNNSSTSTSQRYRKRSELDEQQQQHMCIAWGNFNLFNYQRELIREKQKLALWPATRQALIAQAPGPDMLHPLGHVGPNRDANATTLVVEFQNFFRVVKFPTHEEVLKWAHKLASRNTTKKDPSVNNNSASGTARSVSEAEIKQLDAIIKRDSLSELSEQEKSFLYSVRQFCVDYRPDALPKLLESIRWNSRDEVSQLYLLLEQWRERHILPLVKALTLLDFKYPDQNVRMYAAQCLDVLLNDTLLEEYLLQFVQVLKHEQYLYNDVTVFLLRRATRNRRLTHFLFWHMKTELDADPSVRFRFGALLEAVCRASPACVESLKHQVSAINKLKLLSEELRVKHEDGRPKWFVEQLERADYKAALSSLYSPLDPDDQLGELLVDKCFVLSSAKRPLWLVWKNPDEVARLWFAENEIIFKNGDDLRQDMLTLQSLRLMDGIWQAADLDLRVLPYNCTSLGINTGMIEVVRKSKTIMQIQQAAGGAKGKYQMDYTAIHRWLKAHNPSEERYRQSIQNFTSSCAGYCVATYILGIGDRHPDNIMLTEDGRIFHIDFGHFLGHFKKKFGISRERVPFVLIRDFVLVIAQGDTRATTASECFTSFADLCCKAYRILWHRGDLFIALFSMMLSTGIPELQSIDDLSYLRTTLGVDRTEAAAISHFQEKFKEAHVKAWTTKLDWVCHGIKH